MTFRQRAKIIVELDRLGYVRSKYFIGTEDEVLTEAHDWMHTVALQFIEENDIEAFVQKLESLYPSIQYVNKLTTHSWGQKVIRFYDLDGNLIEVGTPT